MARSLTAAGWLVFGAILTRFTVAAPALWNLAAAFVLAGTITLAVRRHSLRDRTAAVTRRGWTPSPSPLSAPPRSWPFA
ncbi:hypothetical protein [Arthrobacter sp. CAN_C5]|uniref:hypothetical protein n=1 Tax=Arthrobacter sp. CAN_C5 TaxID=2760706 RepID=UPI001AE4B38F|nr:hypothetical protein [Arthrobacter sp. CAN_C5]MBP2215780.1 hypothetical protein [Arthrobacter sp. CAN_C5]